MRAALACPLRLCIRSTSIVVSSRCRVNRVVFLVLFLLSLLDDVCECRVVIVFPGGFGHSVRLCSGTGSVLERFLGILLCFLIAVESLLMLQMTLCASFVCF